MIFIGCQRCMKVSSTRGDRGVIQVSKSKAIILLVCDRSHDTIGIPYEESETYRSQDANLSYSDDTDMKNNDSYAPLPTPSDSTGDPGRTQLLTPVSISPPGTDDANLQRHLTTAATHRSIPRFPCPVSGCRTLCMRHDNLRAHISRVHGGSL